MPGWAVGDLASAIVNRRGQTRGGILAQALQEGTGLIEPQVGHPYGILEERGHTTARLREEVSARMPTAGEVQLLRLSPGVPVLDVWHTSIGQDGQPYEPTRFVMRTGLTGLHYDAPIG